MRPFTLLVFVCTVFCLENVYGDEVASTQDSESSSTQDKSIEGEDITVTTGFTVEDAISAENMPDGDDINAPTEDLSIADKVANQVDGSQNDIDGAEEETSPQAESEEMDTFTDVVQSQPADDDDSKQETFTDIVEPQHDQDVQSQPTSDDESKQETYTAAVETQPAEGTVDASTDADSSSKMPNETLAGLEVNSSLGAVDTIKLSTGKFEPYDGMEIPTFAATFPGCTCTYNEFRNRWKCAGTIAHPASVAGDECCCCTLKCQWRNRCTNEQCEAIGIDQAEEVAAEEKRMKELMKGADILIGDELPGFITDLGKGRCDQNRILQGCKARNMVPLCDHTSYARGQCYSPGLSGTKFHNRHFSHWNSHRQYFGIDDDDYLFYGMCFFANNPNGLAPCNGNSHCWTNGNHRLSPPARVTSVEPVPNIHFNDLTNCRKREAGGLGCWRTICIKDSPNNLR